VQLSRARQDTRLYAVVGPEPQGPAELDLSDREVGDGYAQLAQALSRAGDQRLAIDTPSTLDLRRLSTRELRAERDRLRALLDQAPRDRTRELVRATAHRAEAEQARRFPTIQFERYADDGVVHCVSRRQAQYVRRAIGDRMAQVGLRLHPDKTRVVYCKDGNRRGSYEHTSFTLLGYTFRARAARGPGGNVFTAFLPAVSKEALKRLSRTVRRWQLHRRTELSRAELAEMINPVVRGWSSTTARSTALSMLLARINTYLGALDRKNYRRLRAHGKARAAWDRVTMQFPGYFAHWAWVRYPVMIKMARAE
jgi:hypothetical protein